MSKESCFPFDMLLFVLFSIQLIPLHSFFGNTTFIHEMDEIPLIMSLQLTARTEGLVCALEPVRQTSTAVVLQVNVIDNSPLFFVLIMLLCQLISELALNLSRK